jgi:hypothetical protein
MSKAIAYNLQLWLPICRVAKPETDNNRLENKIRLLAIGRKNYLFAGSHKSAERAIPYLPCEGWKA